MGGSTNVAQRYSWFSGENKDHSSQQGMLWGFLDGYIVMLELVHLNELFPLLSPHTRLLAPCFGYTKLFLVLLDFVFLEGDRQESNDHGSKLKSRLRQGQRESGL